MSLARKHRDRILASQMASAPVSESGLSHPASAPSSDAGTPAERAAASIAMRLQHDLRRLKEIKSIDARVAVKREMLPHYHEWIRGLLQGGREANAGIAEEVLPTAMVWLMDIGEYGPALEIAEHVLRYDVPLPARYQRDAASLVTEEIADAAIRAQTAKQPFAIEILELVEGLTHEADMHDEVRAKLHKAIGTELARAAEDLDPTKPEFVVAAVRALAPLREAVRLHDRVGVAGQIKRLEKAITKRAEPATPDATPDTAGSTGS